MWVNVTDSNGGYRYRCKVTDSSGNVVYSEPGEIKLARETWTFTYDADGMRTSRSSSSATYSYVYNGSQLSQMTVDGNTLYFAYDASGTPISVAYNGTAYYYATNLQGDITAILNTSGTAVVTYTYDAWGNILSTSGSMASTLGTHNPLRYRGYVYDSETGLYYLQSRYYNPKIGRFLNADVFVSTGQGLLGSNMFTYSLNNPVIFQDLSGECGTVAVSATVIAIVSLAIVTITNPYLLEGLYNAIYTTLSGAFTWINAQIEEVKNALANSLAKVISPEYRGRHEHHIVAKADPRAVFSRAILEYLFPEGVWDSDNLVMVDARIHSRLHTNLYFILVECIIIDAYLSAAPTKADQERSVRAALKSLGSIIEAFSNLLT